LKAFTVGECSYLFTDRYTALTGPYGRHIKPNRICHQSKPGAQAGGQRASENAARILSKHTPGLLSKKKKVPHPKQPVELFFFLQNETNNPELPELLFGYEKS
jgi:hypothetical protein